MNTGDKCPSFEEAHDFLTGNLAEVIQTGATEALAEWLASCRDGYAEAKAHRQLMELATRCETEFRKERDRQRAENEEMRDFYRRQAA